MAIDSGGCSHVGQVSDWLLDSSSGRFTRDWHRYWERRGGSSRNNRRSSSSSRRSDLDVAAGDEVEDVGEVGGEDACEEEHAGDDGGAAGEGVAEVGCDLLADDGVRGELVAEEDAGLAEAGPDGDGRVLDRVGVVVGADAAAAAVAELDWDDLEEVDGAPLLRLREGVRGAVGGRGLGEGEGADAEQGPEAAAEAARGGRGVGEGEVVHGVARVEDVELRGREEVHVADGLALRRAEVRVRVARLLRHAPERDVELAVHAVHRKRAVHAAPAAPRRLALELPLGAQLQLPGHVHHVKAKAPARHRRERDVQRHPHVVLLRDRPRVHVQRAHPLVPPHKMSHLVKKHLHSQQRNNNKHCGGAHIE